MPKPGEVSVFPKICIVAGKIKKQTLKSFTPWETNEMYAGSGTVSFAYSIIKVKNTHTEVKSRINLYKMSL